MQSFNKGKLSNIAEEDRPAATGIPYMRYPYLHLNYALTASMAEERVGFCA